MIEVTSTDERALVESAVEQAKRLEPDQPIRLRLQPQVYIKGRGYSLWRLVTWTLAVTTTKEAEAVRSALGSFFRRLATDGPEAVQRVLDAGDDPT